MPDIKKTMEENLGISFEPAPEKEIPKEVEIIPENPLNTDSENDYELARQTYKNLIVKGNDAIDEIAAIASQDEKARSYEVIATLIKTVSETTDKLYEIHKKKKDLNTVKGTRGDINVEKAVFVGSNVDMLRRLKEKNGI